MDEHTPSSSTNAEPGPPKRHLPSRNRRYLGGAVGSEVDDQIIMEVQRKKGAEQIIDAKNPMRLTTDSSWVKSSDARKVDTYTPQAHFDRPDVIESFRKQIIIATPEVVNIKEHPNEAVGSRFRPREIDKTIVNDSDTAFAKRHRKHVGREKRIRLRELETLKHEHHKLKARIEQLRALDSSAFLSLPAESFPPPPDVEEAEEEEPSYLDIYINGAVVSAEGERRRKEMLDAAKTLDDRYRTLLPPDHKGSKKGIKSAPIEYHTPVEQEGEDEFATAGALKEVERLKVVLPTRSNTSTPSASAPSPTYSKPNAAVPGPARRGRPPKNASGKGKKPAHTPSRLPTPPPPPPPTSSAPTSPRAFSHTTETDANVMTIEVSDMRTPLPPPSAPPPARFIAPPEHTVLETLHTPTAPPLSPARMPETEHIEVVEEPLSRPRKRLKPMVSEPPETPPSPRAPSLPPIESISAAQIDSPAVQAHSPMAEVRSPAIPVKSPVVSVYHSPVASVHPLPVVSAHHSPAQPESPMIQVHSPEAPQVQLITVEAEPPRAQARSPSVQASVSTKRTGKHAPKIKLPIIIQVARRFVSTRDRAPRHVTAFGVKLPPILTNPAGTVYEFAIPEWVHEPEEPPPIPSMTGRVPDGDESDYDDELYEPPPLLPMGAGTNGERTNLGTRSATPIPILKEPDQVPVSPRRLRNTLGVSEDWRMEE